MKRMAMLAVAGALIAGCSGEAWENESTVKEKHRLEACKSIRDPKLAYTCITKEKPPK